MIWACRNRRLLVLLVTTFAAALTLAACGGGETLVDADTAPSKLVVLLEDLPDALMLRIDSEETGAVTTEQAVANLSAADAEPSATNESPDSSRSFGARS